MTGEEILKFKTKHMAPRQKLIEELNDIIDYFESTISLAYTEGGRKCAKRRKQTVITARDLLKES